MGTPREMDDAANKARRELDRNWEKWTAHDVAVWWKKWYSRAGHNRLARVLIAVDDDPPI